ncbi:MAG: two component transcriptional regulator, partial [Candidatus Peregrinibacteria bacterium Greene1014_49]
MGMISADILIAEDDAVLREVYQKKVTSSGYCIRLAQNGEEAIAAIQAKIPDILILDLNMPILDGFQVLEKFPKVSRTFPVIALTNFEDKASRDRGEALGVDDYFIKREMTIKQLIAMVEEILKKG